MENSCRSYTVDVYKYKNYITLRLLKMLLLTSCRRHAIFLILDSRPSSLNKSYRYDLTYNVPVVNVAGGVVRRERVTFDVVGGVYKTPSPKRYRYDLTYNVPAVNVAGGVYKTTSRRVTTGARNLVAGGVYKTPSPKRYRYDLTYNVPIVNGVPQHRVTFNVAGGVYKPYSETKPNAATISVRIRGINEVLMQTKLRFTAPAGFEWIHPGTLRSKKAGANPNEVFDSNMFSDWPGGDSPNIHPDTKHILTFDDIVSSVNGVQRGTYIFTNGGNEMHGFAIDVKVRCYSYSRSGPFVTGRTSSTCQWSRMMITQYHFQFHHIIFIWLMHFHHAMIAIRRAHSPPFA